MIDQDTMKTTQGKATEWLSGNGLWRVGFTREAIPLITLMSGLVEVVDTFWQTEDKVLVFIVRNLDTTGTLFKQGVLRANPILKYKPIHQPVLAPS
jgi:hypothetical protein